DKIIVGLLISCSSLQSKPESKSHEQKRQKKKKKNNKILPTKCCFHCQLLLLRIAGVRVSSSSAAESDVELNKRIVGTSNRHWGIRVRFESGASDNLETLWFWSSKTYSVVCLLRKQ
ncbi:hypothetical protein Droror1_Dr00000643, partial [Drosera rotundifolia]